MLKRGGWRAALAVALVTGSSIAVRPNDRITKPVSFAILEDYDKNESLEDIERDFRLFNELEVRTWRGSFGWDDYEPSRGSYDFAWLERFAERAAAHDIRLRPYIGYTPAWAARQAGGGTVWNRPPGRVDDWSRFVAALARAMSRHRNVISFEIYNEENVSQWWDGSPADYADVFSAAAHGIRRVNRRMPVILGGLVFPDAEWLEQVCQRGSLGRLFEILPVHAYPETWTPPDVTVESYASSIGAFVPAAERACGKKSIWINETGFATVPGRSERDQANWWVRAIASFLAQPRVEHIGIYEIKDLPLDRAAIGDAPNYHLGLTRSDRSRKLAFNTVDMLTDLFDTGRITIAENAVKIVARAPAEGELYHHAFVRPDGDVIVVVWNRTADTRIDIDVRNAASVTEYSLDGSRVPASLIDVELASGQPRILRIRLR